MQDYLALPPQSKWGEYEQKRKKTASKHLGSGRGLFLGNLTCIDDAKRSVNFHLRGDMIGR